MPILYWFLHVEDNNWKMLEFSLSILCSFSAMIENLNRTDQFLFLYIRAAICCYKGKYWFSSWRILWSKGSWWVDRSKLDERIQWAWCEFSSWTSFNISKCTILCSETSVKEKHNLLILISCVLFSFSFCTINSSEDKITCAVTQFLKKLFCFPLDFSLHDCKFDYSDDIECTHHILTADVVTDSKVDCGFLVINVSSLYLLVIYFVMLSILLPLVRY